MVVELLLVCEAHHLMNDERKTYKKLTYLGSPVSGQLSTLHLVVDSLVYSTGKVRCTQTNPNPQDLILRQDLKAESLRNQSCRSYLFSVFPVKQRAKSYVHELGEDSSGKYDNRLSYFVAVQRFSG